MDNKGPVNYFPKAFQKLALKFLGSLKELHEVAEPYKFELCIEERLVKSENQRQDHHHCVDESGRCKKQENQRYAPLGCRDVFSFQEASSRRKTGLDFRRLREPRSTAGPPQGDSGAMHISVGWWFVPAVKSSLQSCTRSLWGFRTFQNLNRSVPVLRNQVSACHGSILHS